MCKKRPLLRGHRYVVSWQLVPKGPPVKASRHRRGEATRIFEHRCEERRRPAVLAGWLERIGRRAIPLAPRIFERVSRNDVKFLQCNDKKKRTNKLRETDRTCSLCLLTLRNGGFAATRTPQRLYISFEWYFLGREEKGEAAAFVYRETKATIIPPFTSSSYYVLRVLSFCYFEFRITNFGRLLFVSSPPRIVRWNSNWRKFDNC